MPVQRHGHKVQICVYVYFQQGINKILCTRNIEANYYRSLTNDFKFRACTIIE